MDDLISRQAAIDEIKALYEWHDTVMEDRTIDHLKRLPSAQPEQRWIPCSERLPEEPFGCLVTVWDTNPVTMDEFENILPYFVGWDGEQWNDGDGEQCPFEVIAWMPLPEPYKADFSQYGKAGRMSVVIKGMRMPENCASCPFAERIPPGRTRCLLTCRLLAEDYEAPSQLKRNEYCPIEERPTPSPARWIPIRRGERGYSAGGFRCSQCGMPDRGWGKTNYCPQCGAWMHGGKQNEQSKQ